MIKTKNDAFIISLGYKILGYNKGKYVVECPFGHSFERLTEHFKRGTVSCKVCEQDKLKQRDILLIKNSGYEVLEYKPDRFGNCTVKCPKNHIFYRSVNNFKIGRTNCPECETEVVSNKYRELVEAQGYIFRKYDVDKCEIVCPNGHNIVRFTHLLKEGKLRCPICSPSRSNFEIDVEKELKVLGVEFVSNTFGILGDKELDFYLPKYKLAIECNGDYWHSIKFKNEPKCHFYKYNLCKEKGIRLVQIPESEWYSRKEWFISLIKCYINSGDFSQFLEGDTFNLMYVSELLFENYEIIEPSISESGSQKYWNCGFGVLRKL